MTVTGQWDSFAIYINRKKSGVISITATVSLDGTIYKVTHNRDGDSAADQVLHDATHMAMTLLTSAPGLGLSDEF